MDEITLTVPMHAKLNSENQRVRLNDRRPVRRRPGVDPSGESGLDPVEARGLEEMGMGGPEDRIGKSDGGTVGAIPIEQTSKNRSTLMLPV